MKEFLYAAGGLLWIVAALLFASASSAPQQAVAGLIGVSGSVLFAAATILGALEQLQEKLPKSA